MEGLATKWFCKRPVAALKQLIVMICSVSCLANMEFAMVTLSKARAHGLRTPRPSNRAKRSDACCCSRHFAPRCSVHLELKQGPRLVEPVITAYVCTWKMLVNTCHCRRASEGISDCSIYLPHPLHVFAVERWLPRSHHRHGHCRQY